MAVTAQDIVLARCSTDCVVRRIAGKEIVAAAADRVLDQGAWIASELQGIEDVAAGEFTVSQGGQLLLAGNRPPAW